MANFIGEKLNNITKDKKVFFYHDDERKIKQLSKEEYIKKDIVVHFPRGRKNPNKYTNINKITYVGFKNKLPTGVIKSVNFGYGFTKVLNPVAYFLDDMFKLTEITILKNGNSKLDLVAKKLIINEFDLQKLYKALDFTLKLNKAQLNSTVNEILYKVFPSQIAKPKKSFVPNSIAVTLNRWDNSLDVFSDSDKDAIKELFDKLSLTKEDFLTETSLAKTKEIVDNKYLKQTIAGFKKLMTANSDTKGLEKKWQKFLTENNWVLSTLFSQPVILNNNEAYVGGKAIDNSNGKIGDFLMKNKLSDNVAFTEIKTHLTTLMENKPYRGIDVYAPSKELSGSVAQVLNQRDNFQKGFYVLQADSSHLSNFETFNSRCIVLVGSIKALTTHQKEAFELLRSNSKDVDIITFDELEIKLQGFQTLLSGKIPTSKKKPTTKKKATPKKKAATKKK